MKTRKFLIVGLACLACFLLTFAIYGPEATVASLLIVPLLGTVTAPLPEAEFQSKVLGGLAAADAAAKAATSKADQLLQDVGRLDKETKRVLDDITALKKTANDSDANRLEFVRKLSLLETRLRTESRAAFGNPIERISADEELRLRLNAAVRLAVTKSGVDDMGRLVRSHFPAEFVKRALGEDSSPGSTLINDQLAREIYSTLASFGVWNTFAVRNLGTKITKYPVKTARAVANFVLTEADTIADDSTKAGTSVNLEAEVIAALLNVSLQLLEDAEFDVTADVLDDFAEAFSFRLDWAALQADGGSDATDGGMTGIFGGGGTASVAASGNTTVETLDFEDVTKALLTVDPAVLTRPARWWMHPQILVRMLSVKDLSGRPIFLTANEAPTTGIGSILGYPVTLAMAAPSANTASSRVAVFGDPNGMVVGVRRDFAFEASDHHRWNTFQRSFRGVGRAGVRVRRSQAFGVLTLAAS